MNWLLFRVFENGRPVGQALRARLVHHTDSARALLDQGEALGRRAHGGRLLHVTLEDFLLDLGQQDVLAGADELLREPLELRAAARAEAELDLLPVLPARPFAGENLLQVFFAGRSDVVLSALDED